MKPTAHGVGLSKTGILLITCSSDYLHPYGEGLLIGVGREVIVEGDSAYERGRRWRYSTSRI
ncbi:beta-propeller domain-containing protein [Candidatus Bathyarchaeota archaeon]|nr:beta-propeller domain-containing protein [Candidatus Bathyarchaeota archaeon]